MKIINNQTNLVCVIFPFSVLIAIHFPFQLQTALADAVASPNIKPASSSSQSVQHRDASTVIPIEQSPRPPNAPASTEKPGPADDPALNEIILEPTRPVSGLENLYSILENGQRDKTFSGPVIPILVFACNRVSVRKCLDNLIEYRPNVNQFPIIVSQVNDE